MAPSRSTSTTSRPCTGSLPSGKSSAISDRSAGIRIGPHYYTSDAELEHVIVQIVEIVSTGAHLRHLGAVARH